MSDDALPAPEFVKKPWVRPLSGPGSGLVPFKKGDDPRRNSKGRLVNSKNLVSDAFVKDLMKWHAKHGMKAIERVGREQPVALLQIIASFVPRKAQVEHEHTGSVTFAPVSVQEVEQRTRELLARIIDGDAADVSEG